MRAPALATCRVFVPLYSSGYFADERCGKEWAYFVSRAPAGDRSGAPIVPGVWVPVEAESFRTRRGYL